MARNVTTRDEIILALSATAGTRLMLSSLYRRFGHRSDFREALSLLQRQRMVKIATLTSSARQRGRRPKWCVLR